MTRSQCIDKFHVSNQDEELKHQSPLTASHISVQHLYESLSLPRGSASIRLLTLDALQTGKDYSLKGTLKVAPLQDSVSFDALSYVWLEDGEEIHNIQHNILCTVHGSVHACHIEITANCHRALVEIRNRFGPVTIWVDSICINQKDNDEKENQIPLMQDIYTNAARLFVWLGPVHGQSDRAVSYLRLCGATGRRIPLQYLAARSERDMRRGLREFKIRAWGDIFYRLRYLVAGHRCDLDEILDRKWVHRAWTLQELILASNPIILCGNKLLQWEDVVSAISYGSTIRQPDLSSLQASREAVNHWRSLINMWLDFPRKWESADDSTDTERRPKLSFRDKIKFPSRTISLPLGLRCLHTVVQVVYLMSALGSWSYTTYKVMLSAAHSISSTSLRLSEPTTNKSSSTSHALWFLVIFAWILATLIFIGVAILISALIGFIFCGETQRWVLQETVSQSSETYTPLNAIRAALRERKSSDDHDRAFALFGILRSLGVSTSQVTYQQPVHQTNRNLFQDLLAWTPDALIILADANLETHDDGPSWVPNWAKLTAHPWLSSRRILQDSELDQRHRARTPPFRIGDSNLTVQGYVEGSVLFRVDFNKSTEEQTEETMLLDLDRLIRWIYWCQRNCRKRKAYVVEVSYMFAILEGLSGPQKVRTGILTAPGQVSLGRRTVTDPRTAVTKLPLVEAPFDFRSRKKDFMAFCTFHKMLDAFLRSNRNNSCGEQQLVTTLHSVHRMVKADKVIAGYTKELVRRLVTDRRCLFVLSNGTAGSGPLAMKVDDEVFTLSGVPTPMALRQEQDANAYKVVGAAFVHGLMYDNFINDRMLTDVNLL